MTASGLHPVLVCGPQIRLPLYRFEIHFCQSDRDQADGAAQSAPTQECHDPIAGRRQEAGANPK